MGKNGREKKRNRQRKLEAVVFLVVLLLSGCQIAVTVPAAEETKIEAEQAVQDKEEIVTTKQEENRMEFSSIEFKQGNIFISYPQLEENRREEKEIEKKLNEQLKQDALRVLEFYGVNTEVDFLKVSYEIKGATETEISILYTGYYLAEGTAYPSNLIYTSNLSLENGTHQKLSDRTDIKELAQSIIDKNYKIIGEQKQEEFREGIETELSSYTKEELTENLENADFSETCYEAYPNWFSYWEEKEEEKYNYLIIPIIHALGDYIILQIKK